MNRQRLMELAGIDIKAVVINEAAKVNWDAAAMDIASELVSKMVKADSSVFGEDVEYILNQANEEIMDFIFDKFAEANVRGKLKGIIEKERKRIQAQRRTEDEQ